MPPLPLLFKLRDARIKLRIYLSFKFGISLVNFHTESYNTKRET